jgi:hypothetical protein
MARDPREVLGVDPDASIEDAHAAFRRLAALFHPDHLEGMSEEVRAEGARRLREATEAWEVVQALAARADPGPAGAPAVDAADLAECTYNVQVSGLAADGLHATWPGRHAAAVWSALQRAHLSDERVQQVEWGAYECTLAGAGVRRLLREAMPPVGTDWSREPLGTLDFGPRRDRCRYVWHPGAYPPGVMDLGALDELLEDRLEYVVTAEVFSALD